MSAADMTACSPNVTLKGITYNYYYAYDSTGAEAGKYVATLTAVDNYTTVEKEEFVLE